MKITKIELYKMNLPIKYPIKTAVGVVSFNTENVLVKIYTDSDIYGLGEASPFSQITGDTQGSNLSVGQNISKLILNKNPLEIEDRMKEINRFIAGEPSIRSAFDMALYDILGKVANLPVFRLLGGSNRKLVTDCTIGWQDTVEETVDRAQDLVQQGFNELKFKTGRAGMIDVDYIKAVREAVGPDILIKIDSNQGWDVAQTISNAIALEPYNLRYIEQPIPVWDFQGFREIRSKIKTPLCADESVFNDKDAFKLCAIGAVDYLNIKLGKAGGIHMGLKINAIAESYGAKCMIGCFTESRLGLTAAAHLVLARPNIVFLDLDSALIIDEDPIIGGMEYGEKNKSFITVGDKPGLGAELKEEYLQKWKSFKVE